MIPMPYHKVCFARHGCMNCILSKQPAKFTVIWICRSTSDNVTWINVFDGNRSIIKLKFRCNFFFQINANIFISDIPRCIFFYSSGFEKFLSGSFCYYDKSMMSIFDTFSQKMQKTIRSIQIKI